MPTSGGWSVMLSAPRLLPPKAHLHLLLVEELCALDCVRDPGQRVLFGQSVGDYLKRPVDLPGRDARNDTVALVQAVLRDQEDLETAVEALLYAVVLHEGSDVGGTVRERVLSTWRPEADLPLPLLEAFGATDVSDGRALLIGHPGVDRNKLRDRLAHELRLDLPHHLAPAELFDHLLNANAQADGLPPAVLLVELTAVLTAGESERQRLRGWCDAWSARAGVQETLLRRRRQIEAASPPDQEIPRCLTIMVDPAADGSPDIYVRHWVNPTAGYWAPLAGSTERTTMQSLGAAVERAIRLGEEFWATADCAGDDPSPVHVEFVLPYALLNHDVAGLGTDTDGSGAVPIGLRYYVHLRSLERMRARDPGQLRRWRLRWKALRAAAVAHPHGWTAGAGDHTAGLRIWRNKLVADQQLTAVTLNAPALEGQALEPLKAAIAEGVGVALWDRRDPALQQVPTQLDMFIAYPAAQLPVTIHRLRMKAETDENGAQLPGRHVALLYDDPFRLIDCEEVPA
ncbi:VMAP-C domain-containing protein [Streptomyces spongiae]|uniref:Uncharacterized protein n=1 Tax=Streptomyces spongiae TaxID=565072 RepID=A0A5N8XZX2_9ACTN|nr:hypothetical protein [Streptomyces spongiae]MPY64909.1 hypothetical protein [Streptomyces spongiae]